jgi:hypothetical protein
MKWQVPKVLAGLWALILLTFCALPSGAREDVKVIHSEGSTIPPVCAPEIDDAVLRALLDRGNLTKLSLDCDGISLEELRCLDRDLMRLYTWTTTLKDVCVFQAYNKWLGHYSREAQECRRRLTDAVARKEIGQRNTFEDARARHQRRWEATHKIPKPPPHEPCSQKN